MGETVIDFLRHGEPEGGRRYRGDGVDDPLSEKGWRQIWRAVGERIPWQRVVSSSLARCQGFARALSERHTIPLSVDEHFREVGFGDWEGRTADDISAQNAAEFNAFYQDPLRNRPPDAEPLATFGRRVAAALDDLLDGDPAEAVLVVAHAGVIRAALDY